MENPVINKEAIQQLQIALTPVVEKLGQGGEWVYKVYYKQQIVYGTQWLIAAVLFLGVLIALLTNFKKLKQWDDESGGYDKGFLPGLAIFGMFGAFALFLVCIGASVGRFINPDYYILQDLLSIIKPTS